MSVYDDLKNADLPIDHPDHPFGIDRYREMVNAEIELGRMTVEAGKASGNLEQENAGKMLLGQRWAVGEEENARWQAEIDAMWAWLRAREEGEDHVPVR